MKTQFSKISSTILFVLLISTSILSAENATHKHQQKIKLFMGINYENYKTSIYSSNFSGIIDSTLSTIDQGISRFHVKLSTPFKTNIGSTNFILDMMIPFGTTEQDLSPFSAFSTYTNHQKFNVFELDIGNEFEF